MSKKTDARNQVLTCKDHTVSGKTFTLQYDKAYDMLVTDPQPYPDELPEYYKSEDYISHTDTQRSWFEKIYQQVKKQALRRKLKQIHRLHPQKGKLLDVGAGTGDFLVAATAKGWEVSGTEPNAKARRIAQRKGIVLYPDIQDLQPMTYDVITLWHVLEHIPDTITQLLQLKTRLKPGGSLMIAVPNYKTFDARYYKEYWAAYDVPRHLWHFSKTAVMKLCSDAGLEVVKILPMYFDAFYISLLSEKYKTGKMNIIKAVSIGLLSNCHAFFKTREYSSHIYIIKHKNIDFKAI